MNNKKMKNNQTIMMNVIMIFLILNYHYRQKSCIFPALSTSSDHYQSQKSENITTKK